MERERSNEYKSKTGQGLQNSVLPNMKKASLNPELLEKLPSAGGITSGYRGNHCAVIVVACRLQRDGKKFK
jgi:hypothetical protein